MNQALLRKLAARFLPAEQLRTLFAGRDCADVEDQVETALAQILGAASARLLLKTARDRQHNLDDVVELVDETSAALRFNQQLLEAALENMSQGISVVNSDLQLMAWNRRYAEMFGFPDALLQIGRPIIELQRWAIEHGFAGDVHDRIEVMLQRRLRHMRAGNPHLTERKFPDGSMVEIRGNPMPGGGYVATFTDVTEFRRSEQRLQDLAGTLEKRVHERTAELSAAKSEAERANRAKSRFLAAISHDVFQPLGAAQLFTHNLAQQLAAQTDKDSHEIASVRNIYAALQSVENLLGSCLDLSKLESGRLQPLLEDFALEELLDGLVLEYSALAREKGLRLRHVPTSCGFTVIVNCCDASSRTTWPMPFATPPAGKCCWAVAAQVMRSACRCSIPVPVSRRMISRWCLKSSSAWLTAKAAPKVSVWGWPSCAALPICWITRCNFNPCPGPARCLAYRCQWRRQGIRRTSLPAACKR